MEVSLSRLLAADRVAGFLSQVPPAWKIRVEEEIQAGSLPAGGALAGMPLAGPTGERWRLSGSEAAREQLPLVKAALEQLFRAEHELWDVTRELSFLYEELTLLYRLSSSFAGNLQLERILERAVEEISQTLDVRKVSILMLDEEREGLTLVAGRGVDPEEIGRRRFNRGDGLAWKALETGFPIIANHPSEMPEYVPGHLPETNLLLVPVTTKSGPAGVLAASNRSDGQEFDSRDEKLLSAIAQQMGAVWENGRLYRETRELFLNTVEALSAAIDAKDPYTHGHSRRVTAFSVAIAEEMGLTESEVEVIRVAALLHDIGKLGISESILRKPDRLTEGEFTEIKRHPVIGAEIMSHVRKLSQFVPGMIDHHERFGGGGYPDGREGGEISLAGRIIAVADTFDAITSNRPYHPDQRGKPDEVGLAEIQRCTGTHYDPAVVGAFLAAYRNGRIKQDPAIQAKD